MKRTLALILAVNLSISITPQGQMPRKTGLILDRTAAMKTPVYELPDRSVFPNYHCLIDADFPVGDQGSTASCVGWGLAHCMEILSEQMPGLFEKKIRGLFGPQLRLPVHIKLSANYIFNQIISPGQCDQGASLENGLFKLMKQGICLADSILKTRVFGFPNTPHSCIQLPSDIHHKIASVFQIREYSSAFPLPADSTIIVQRLKGLILQDQPVLVAINVPLWFVTIEGSIPPDLTWTPPLYPQPHVMVVVGYDDPPKGNGTFTLLNSYGKAWNGDGLCKVPFKDFVHRVEYGYVLTP